jgi:hypothetical protein
MVLLGWDSVRRRPLKSTCAAGGEQDEHEEEEDEEEAAAAAAAWEGILVCRPRLRPRGI